MLSGPTLFKLSFQRKGELPPITTDYSSLAAVRIRVAPRAPTLIMAAQFGKGWPHVDNEAHRNRT
jgi:hypothetical protein